MFWFTRHTGKSYSTNKELCTRGCCGKTKLHICFIGYNAASCLFHLNWRLTFNIRFILLTHMLLNNGRNGDPLGKGNAQLLRKNRSSRNPQLQYPVATANSCIGLLGPTITASSFFSRSLSIAEASPSLEKEFARCSITRSHRPG